MSKTKLYVPIYGVEVILCTTHKAFGKQAQRLGIAPYDITGLAGLCEYSALASHGILLVGVFDAKPGTLVHELFHATVRVLGYVGVPVETDAPNEAYAYLLGYLYENLIDKVRA